MAGAGLIALKRRMKSVVNTRKITKAMGLIATTKLRKVRVSLAKAEDYNNKYSDLFEVAVKSFEGSSIFIKENKSKKKLYVILTSESGLCGGYNGSVVGKVSEITRNDKKNSVIMVIGQRGRSYVKRLKYETAAEYVEVPDIPTIKEATAITRSILNLFENGEYAEVYLVYTKFLSSVKQNVEAKKILPIDIKKDGSYVDTVVFEPALENSFDYIAKEYIKQQVFYSLTSAKASEHASRMNAMDGATKNANELLDKYNLQYNRIRQTTITQEISEIVGGAEAQK